MNKEMTGKYLRQMEHIRGHLWHRYSMYQSWWRPYNIRWLQLNQ